MNNSREVQEVLEKYNFNVTDIKLESYKGKKGVWWIDTKEGMKILKKQPNSKETIEFIVSALNYLRNKGVQIPRIIENNQDCKYTVLNSDYYILSEAIIGERPDYNKRHELKVMVRGLAKFHNASIGFIPPNDCKPKVHLGNLIKEHKENINKLETFYNEEKQMENHNSFGTKILEEFPHFYDRMQSSIKQLNESCYIEWTGRMSSLGCLCHQDFAAGNLVLDKEGNLFILDTDSITIDIPIRDIRKFLNKVMKKSGRWDYDLAKTILLWYQEINPLDYEQWLILKSELEYPHLFSGIMSKYYEQREKSWTEQKYLSRLKEMCEIEKLAEQIINNFESIIPTT
ncbi:MAG: CotS family spore coat protein [Ignavibacteriales bacterium]